MKMRRVLGLLACALVLHGAARAAETVTIRPATAPAAPTTRPAATRPAARVAPEAQPLFDALSKAYAGLRSLSTAGQLRMVIHEDQPRTQTAEFSSTYLAPARFRHEVKNQLILGSTGAELFAYLPAQNRYAKTPLAEGKKLPQSLPPDQAQILRAQDPSLALAVSGDAAAELRAMASEIARGPDQVIDGRTYQTLRLTLNDSAGSAILAIDPQTHLLRRCTIDLRPRFAKAGRPDIQTAEFTIDYTRIAPNAPASEETFAWSAPAGAREIAGVADEEGAVAEAGSPLVGQPAPDFTLEGLDGKEVALSSLKGSVVVLDFWATWCGPCRVSMPHLDRIYQERKPAGLKVFAVNQREDKDKIERFLQNTDLKLPVLLDTDAEVGKKYGVRGIPTTVVIGKDGTVKKVQVGFGPTSAEELRRSIDATMNGQ